MSKSRLEFSILFLQSSSRFDLISFFLVLISLFLTVYEGHVQLMLLRSLCASGFFRKVENNISVLFIVLNLQTVFPLKPMFSEGPSIFVLFCNDGALSFRLHVVALLRHEQPRLHKS